MNDRTSFFSCFFFTFITFLVVHCTIFPTVGPVVPGQSLWCIVKQIADTTDSVESKIFALELGISALDALIVQEITSALSETDLVLQGFSSVDSRIDIVNSQLSVLVSQAEIVSSLIDPIESQLASISACSSMFIIAPTTIAASGTYCLANDIVGPIVITANNVVLNLNNHTVAGTVSIGTGQTLVTVENGVVETNNTSDAIIVSSGTSNITLSRVIVKNALRGINFTGVAGALITHCEMVNNTTGVELNASYGITIDTSSALANAQAGFSLVTSFTNTIRDCIALSTGENNMQAANNSVYGFVTYNGSSNLFENCIANATQALSTTDYNSIVAGFALTGTSDCNKIIGCEASNAITSASGFTVPYGIALQAQVSGLTTVTQLTPTGTISQVGSDVLDSLDWSPDGIYLAAGILRSSANSTSNSLYIYQYNRSTSGLTQIAALVTNFSLYEVQWSPDGRYIAVGGTNSSLSNFRIYSFDKTNQNVALVAQDTTINSSGSTGQNVQAVGWSPDMDYVLIGGQTSSSNAVIELYRFDQVAETLTQTFNATLATNDMYGAPFVSSVDWSPDGSYVAVSGFLFTNQVRLYVLSRASNSLTEVFDISIPNSEPAPIHWSPDGKYLAVNDAGKIFIYSFSQSPNISLTQVVALSEGVFFGDMNWSPDGRYLMGAGFFTIVMYYFDRSTNQLTRVAAQNFTEGSFLSDAVAWSPDGQLIAGPGAIPLVIYNALSFPSDNVIKNNTVYCNSGNAQPGGVGISGSSICNLIIQNTSYSNPINPFSISTNYYFACNVFNPLFNTMPSSLQNISLGSCEPIPIPDNEALLAKQALAGAQLGSILSVLSNTIDSISITTSLSPCLATSITTATVIGASGSYCLANTIAGTISITASNVVLDLNDHTVTAGVSVAAGLNRVTIKNGTVQNTSSADAISVGTGSSNVTISHVTVKNAQRGIVLNSVDGGRIEYCDMVLNLTGLQLNQSSNIVVNKSIARRNYYSGFSLVSSYTNLLTNCQALSTGEGNTTAANNNVYGFISQSGFANVFENCIANATQALSTTDYNSIVAGFALTGTSNCNKIIGCEAANAITSASGFTVPYGILLQGILENPLTLTAVPPIPVPSGNIYAVQWSPDRRYIAVGSDAPDIRIYAFDNANAVLQQIAISAQEQSSQVRTLDWSSDGKYLAVGLAVDAMFSIKIYAFDSTNNSLTQVVFLNKSLTAISIFSVRWSPNGKYLAAASSDSTNSLLVYGFDRVNNTLTLLSTVSLGPFNVFAVDWSNDGLYIAVGLGLSSHKLEVYSFTPGNATLTLSASVPIVSAVNAVRWSPDCNFIAVGILGSSQTLSVYTFAAATSASPALLTLKQSTSQALGNVLTVDWSADGRYIVAGYDASPHLSVYGYDRSANSFTAPISPNINPLQPIECADWSPDGQYIAAGALSPDPNKIYIYSALSFPSDNVITENTVYCNSGNQCPGGVGICAPSICNLIIQNTAYSNPINPSMASSNYQFVCNVFNQLFGDAPTLLQNIALGSCDPIAIPADTALLAKQLQAQSIELQSEIALIATELVAASSVVNVLINACNATPIMGVTTILSSGIYCLANSVSGTIIISASNVVFDLNSNVVIQVLVSTGQDNVTIKNGVVNQTSSTSDAIVVNSGCSNITIQDVTAKNGLRGINFIGVNNGMIESCDVTRNVTGIELNTAAKVTIDATTARANLQSGFSLITTYTSVLSNCKALSTGEGNSTAANNNVYGFISQNGFSNVFENCIANATQALSTTDYNSIVAGFALTGTEQRTKIIGCEAANAITSASGFTVPYGILLQGILESPLTLTAVPPIPVPSGNIYAVQWSPDRRYIAVGSDAPDIRIYAFDNANAVLQQIAVAAQEQSSQVRTLDWSSDGKYLAVGLAVDAMFSIKIYAFDSTNNSLTQVVFLNKSLTAISIFSVRWSPNGKYLAAASSDSTNSLLVYGFDRVNNTLTLLSTVSLGPFNVFAVDWSNDGLYIAVGLGLSSHKLEVYSFTPGNATLTLSASVPIVSAVNAVRWSPDCNFIAVGILGSSQTLSVYTFAAATSASPALLTLKQSTSQALGNVLTVDWSADGRYIVAGYDASPHLSVYGYDRSANSFTAPISPNINPLQPIECADWSPDGQYIAAGALSPDPNKIYIYSALSFPSDNVITENTVYCNSGNQCPGGVGICAPSICNLIIQNTAYSNPINPSMASSNYQFVCNVFNQLFQNRPSLMQNLALGTCEPIATPQNEALLAHQLRYQVLNITNSLLNLFATGDSCASMGIASATTITASGVYCLETTIPGTITISSGDVVLDLNNHVVNFGIVVSSGLDRVTIQNGMVQNTSSADAITVNSGCSDITISNVVARNSRYGATIVGVQGGIISQCDFMSNVTGVELNSSGNIFIKGCTARSNQQSGFSLVLSNTNTIQNCKALATGAGNSSVLKNNVYGFVSQNGYGNVFENCIANATQALSTTDYNSIIAGFALTGAESCTKIIECEASNAATSSGGVTVPYGIYLQNTLSGLTSLTSQSTGSLTDSVSTIAWSSDDVYIAVGGTFAGADVLVFQFNPASTIYALTLVTTVDLGLTVTALTMQWSPDNQFLSVAGVLGSTDLQVYSYDRSNQTLSLSAAVSTGSTSDIVYATAWSPNGNYLAVGGALTGNDFNIYQFDRVAQTLTQVVSQSTGLSTDTIRAVAWSPDGRYVALGGTITGNELQVYSFTPSPATVALVASINFGTDTVNALAWSPDGQYLAVGAQRTLGNNNFLMYQWSPSALTLTLIASTLGSADVLSLSWSSDGRLIAVGGLFTGNDLNIYDFGRGSKSLNLLQSVSPSGTGSDTVQAVQWSPDGRFILAGGVIMGGSDLVLFSALTFPSDNVITNNMVYCNSGAQYPSGVGISGSSVCNLIIQNTAYSNPLNPTIVSSNYYFACNVFNQFFGVGPSLMQNAQLGSCEPIVTPQNEALLAQQFISLASNLTLCGSTPLPGLGTTTLTISGNYCLSADATADVTITATCITFDLNNRTLTGTITVVNSDDVLVTNGKVIAPANAIAAPNAAVRIQSSSNRVTISNTVIRCNGATGNGIAGRVGLQISGSGALVDKCTITSGAASARTTSGVGVSGGDAILVSAGAFNTLIQNSVIMSGNGGAANASGSGGAAGHGIHAAASSSNTRASNCLIFSTGTGGAGAAAVGGNGGNGVQVDSGAITTQIQNCIIRNTGSGGTGTTSGTSGKAVSDQVSTPATSLSQIFANFAHNIANNTKFDLQAAGIEKGVSTPNPPGPANIVLNPLANVFAS